MSFSHELYGLNLMTLDGSTWAHEEVSISFLTLEKKNICAAGVSVVKIGNLP